MLYAALLVLEAILAVCLRCSATRRWFTSRQHQKARIQQHNGLAGSGRGRLGPRRETVPEQRTAQ